MTPEGEGVAATAILEAKPLEAYRLAVDLCVIGAGSGGLSVAAGASQMGLKVVLIERGLMGGDCLNYGCVPSKSLLAAARAAEAVREAGRFGIRAALDGIDFARVRDHVQGVIAEIAPNDSEARFEGLGVTVLKADARFTGTRTVAAGPVTVTARQFVIATGSRAAVPPIPGLRTVPFLTNETIFDLSEAPRHLLIIGGGPVGLEMAQAHLRLGSRVTVIERDRILPHDDPELVDVVRHRLTGEGVHFVEGAGVERVDLDEVGGIAVRLSDGRTIAGTHLLVATGRTPNVEGLNLEAAGVEHDETGIRTDASLRTSNRRIYAVGDVAGGPKFTHVASHHASVVIRKAVLWLPAKVDYRALPWVTYTEPELAQVGLTETAAREKFGKIHILRWGFAENDRARADRDVDGFAKIIMLPGGRVVGAGIVGRQAGELIQLWCLAIAAKVKIGTVASLILPYPTLGEVNKRAAGSHFTPFLFSDRMKRLVRVLARFV